MNYELPTCIELGGVEYTIRCDYRAALDICAALSDIDLTEQERSFAALTIFYPDFPSIPQEYYGQAVDRLVWFLNCGDENSATRKAPKLMDWRQDFPLIVAPINRVAGRDIREAGTSMHWWTFIGYYYEIGECLFSQVVRVRDLKAKGKTLDKFDREFYRDYKHLVDFRVSYSDAEKELLKEWGGDIGR